MSFYSISPSYPKYQLQDFSTADKYYDIEESQRIYEHLLNENIRLKQELQRKKYRNPKQTEIQVSAPHPQLSKLDQGPNDLLLWSLIERNEYMSEKVLKLKKTYEKQVKMIKKIESSEKWQNRNKCTQDHCYQGKYMQLLRIKSPFF